jgi:hypothetical protein
MQLAHPNFAKFIEIILYENEKTRVELIQLKKNIHVGSKNLVKEEMLKLVVSNYENYEDMNFLKILTK